MKNRFLLGGLLCLGLLITSCHKYDWDDISHIGANDKILICKDGNEKSVKAKHVNHWVHKGWTELLDLDGDGYYGAVNSCGYLVDCDDENDTVYPGAVEICDDGIDNNCNELLDCEEADCVSVCADCDDLIAILAAASNDTTGVEGILPVYARYAVSSDSEDPDIEYVEMGRYLFYNSFYDNGEPAIQAIDLKILHNKTDAGGGINYVEVNLQRILESGIIVKESLINENPQTNIYRSRACVAVARDLIFSLGIPIEDVVIND